MFVLSIVVGGLLYATVWLCLRRLRRIEEELWGKKKTK
jgi:hypothetical protein